MIRRMERVAYEGYVIEPHAVALADGRWALTVTLIKDEGSQVVERPFHSQATFGTREEAIQHGFIQGRRIIDDEVPGCTAP